MSIRAYIILLFAIFLSSTCSVGLLYLYMNPVNDPQMAFPMMGIGLFLAVSSLMAPILYFVKKIYYRGDVSLSTMNASIRQAILITIGAIMMLVLYGFHIYEARLVATVWATIACIEVMIQAVE